MPLFVVASVAVAVVPQCSWILIAAYADCFVQSQYPLMSVARYSRAVWIYPDWTSIVDRPHHCNETDTFSLQCKQRDAHSRELKSYLQIRCDGAGFILRNTFIGAKSLHLTSQHFLDDVEMAGETIFHAGHYHQFYLHRLFLTHVYCTS